MSYKYTCVNILIGANVIKMSEEDNPENIREVFRIAFESTGSLTSALLKVWGASFWISVIQLLIACVLQVIILSKV